MSEWIKRSEQEPPKDGTPFVAWMNDGVVRILHWRNDEWNDDDHLPWELWKWWVPLPTQPPRTVAIEISKEVVDIANKEDLS